MKERFYGVELTSVGPNYEKVFSYIKGLYPGVSDSEIRNLLDDCNAGDVVPVSDCIDHVNANKICDEVLKTGAQANVYEMTEAEIQSAIKTGDIVLNNDKSSKKSSQQGPSLSPEAEYMENKKVMWKFMIFCMIGWAIAAIGFSIFLTYDIVGFILIIVGIIVVDLPTYKLLAAGFSLGSLLVATTPVYIIEYSDGSKKRDSSAKQGAMAGAIFIYLITLIVGVIVMVCRIFGCLLTARKIKKKNNLNIKFKDSIWLPTCIGLGEFFVFVIVIAVVNSILHTASLYPKTMTKEEITVLLDKSKADIVTKDFSYYLVDYGDTYDYHTRVMHAGVDNSYLVVLDGAAQSHYGIDNGTYLYYKNKWELVTNFETKETTATTFGEKLEQFRIENLVEYDAMKADIQNVYGENEKNAVYDMIYWHKAGGLRSFNFNKSGQLVQINQVPFLMDHQTTIHYDMKFGGAFDNN